ncbi:Gfo/Idh/MocA family oxidoreductase [Saccharothrix violaceirubra]|uniref:Putative dehydrogenase n=1 Tax=Saccharothrix violaceirubra TaxID=413306 RepID=A0A7W7WZJ5_9PSEU|nr:Gfo/Idh/MocA family oxidoreductase [Saccharothrix violaceirubra]MBB4968956.1 putative dehydrogenase [Saccharothrix violaceirubra]
MDEQLRVGLIGAGPWAERVHAPAIAGHPGSRLVSVWARRPEAAAGLAGAHGAATASSPEELISQVDAVAFAVPPEVQAPLAIQAAEAGRHVVLEKPIAGSLDEARRLADAVDRAGVASLVVLTKRYTPDTREQLERVHAEGGWVGGSVRWLTGALLSGPYSHSPWRHERGALDDLGPHVFDLLDAALGPVVEVVAADRSAHDVWQVVLRHEGGATSTAMLTMSLAVSPPVLEVEVYGTAGQRTLTTPATTPIEAYTNLLDEFAALIDSGKTSHPLDVRRGLHLQSIIAKIRESSTRTP